MTPQEQKEAAEQARKDGQPAENPPKTEPSDIKGSPSKLQSPVPPAKP